MAKLPNPPEPSVLAQLGADIHTLAAGSRIWRVYFQGGAHPTTWNQFRAWGPTNARFDHHPPPASLKTTEQILYGAIGANAAVTSIAEVFQATRVVDRRHAAPSWVAFECTRDIALLDLTGTWPTRAGASMAISTGPRSRARLWSQAIYAAFPQIDGLLYSSSMNANQPSIALYERASTAMPTAPVFHRQLVDPVVLTLLKNACNAVNYSLV